MTSAILFCMSSARLAESEDTDLHLHWYVPSSTDPSLPSKSFMKLIGGLQKRQAGLYTQLRTGHAPLNRHLHRYRFKRSDTPNRLQCGDSTPDIIHHFLFMCPRYNRERFIMERDVGRKVTYLLTSANAKTHLLSYIKPNACFRHSVRYRSYHLKHS